jgi:hypothetical protein
MPIINNHNLNLSAIDFKSIFILWKGIKANFTPFENQEFESLKLKSHEDLAEYITNIDAEINTKEKEMQQ